MPEASLYEYRLEGVYAGGLPDAPPVLYDPARHLPPDVASESLAGYDGQAALRRVDSKKGSGADTPLRVLVPGIGVGTLACSFLAHEQKQQALGATPIHIDGFDIDPSAVDLAKRNLSGYTTTRFSCNIYQADWNRTETWESLSPHAYNLILFNPPYLPDAEASVIRASYAQVPKTATAGGKDGLDHFRRVIPQLPSLMDHRNGSTLLFRFRTPGNEQAKALHDICADAFGGMTWPSGLFPTEGMANERLDKDGRLRWLSYGRIILHPQRSSNVVRSAAPNQKHQV
ncbi:MAG TPA: hypothetical protein VD735_04805 [Candidatus Saccharimonadales bacterium]|nr:hypothetical protein [Candidatus Saccharimonadales bacterium]